MNFSWGLTAFSWKSWNGMPDTRQGSSGEPSSALVSWRQSVHSDVLPKNQTFQRHLKKLAPNVFSKDIWRAIEMILWRQDIPCMPKGSATDGLDPEEIESTKRGVEIHGGIWFLPEGRGSPNPRYEMTMCLSRPRFSSIESVTVDKLQTATISASEFEDGFLTLTVT